MKPKYPGLLLTAILAMTLGLTSCLEEFTPTEYATEGQVKDELNGLSNGIAAYMTTYRSDYMYSDIGFAAHLIWRDASTADFPIYDSGYDYFTEVELCNYLGAFQVFPDLMWARYYGLIQKTNLLLGAVDLKSNPDGASYVVNALAYRANAYMELAQWVEFHRTGYAAFDDKAASDGIMGLTAPIVTQDTTETQGRHNPRAPYYKMYRFILSDLDAAERHSLGAPEPDRRTDAGPGVTYGLMARFWLLLGTRFDLHPEDLATAIAHENDADIPYPKLAVTSPRECYAKAAQYARKAINCGYAPLSETQWFDPKSGFNSVNNAWMWANIISPNNGLASSMTWGSWVSYMSPEATYGVSTTEYGAYRMIDARLYASIGSGDWRKPTWIDPADAGSETAYNTKYARGTTMPYREWKAYAPYASFKFHPGSGDRNDSKAGNAVSIPLMRIEEMYLIEAEAAGRANGDAAGRALLETFMNTYRYTDASYRSTGIGLEGFIDDVFTQKRIELWGEGQILWDYRRMEKAIVRGYPGTNYSEPTRFNSLPGYVAPWTTWSIPNAERNYNKAIILNPDPSSTGLYDAWTE